MDEEERLRTEPYSKTAKELKDGKVPEEEALLRDLTCALPFLTDFWREKYLKEYIRQGGSKIKFVTGGKGSGKSHLLKLTAALAREEDYVTAEFSAEDVWLHDFSEIYKEVLRQADLEVCLRRLSRRIVENCGFDPDEIPEGDSFMDYLYSCGMADAITRREIRLQLKHLFLEDPLIDNNFALACSLLTGGILGHPMLENQNRELLLSWLSGDRTVKLASLRSLGLSPTRITKLNARQMLCSLARIITLSGASGLVVVIDDLDILASKSSLGTIHYTRVRREDTYESIRQLIDEIDSMKNILFLFGFDRELIDNESFGLKSYQALWMRIQNEIISKRVNRFADILDMDELGKQIYTPAVIAEMSEKLCAAAQKEGLSAHALDEETAMEILNQAKAGALGIPALVHEAVFKEPEETPAEGAEEEPEAPAEENADPETASIPIEEGDPQYGEWEVRSDV